MPSPEIVNTFKLYNKMAEWYWPAGDKQKAIYAQKKALKALKKIRLFCEQYGLYAHHCLKA
jgi:hypothetical protein